jgi:hypothetical protein
MAKIVAVRETCQLGWIAVANFYLRAELEATKPKVRCADADS